MKCSSFLKMKELFGSEGCRIVRLSSRATLYLDISACKLNTHTLGLNAYVGIGRLRMEMGRNHQLMGRGYLQMTHFNSKMGWYSKQDRHYSECLISGEIESC